MTEILSDLSENDSNSDTDTPGHVHVNTDQQTSLNTAPHSLDPASYVGRKLSDDDRLQLLTSTSNILAGFCFPVTSGRRFNPNWLINRPWLRYSMGKDCIRVSCVCFSALSDSPFVLSGYRNWKKAMGKKSGYIDQHTRSDSHRLADEKLLYFYKHVSLVLIFMRY